MTRVNPPARATRRLAIALLAALMLLGQGSALAHKLDLDRHAAGHVCEWCVAHAGLDHAVVDVSPPALGQAVSPDDPATTTTRVEPRAPTCHPARAPPVCS